MLLHGVQDGAAGVYGIEVAGKTGTAKILMVMLMPGLLVLHLMKIL